MKFQLMAVLTFSRGHLCVVELGPKFLYYALAITQPAFFLYKKFRGKKLKIQASPDLVPPAIRFVDIDLVGVETFRIQKS